MNDRTTFILSYAYDPDGEPCCECLIVDGSCPAWQAAEPGTSDPDPSLTAQDHLDYAAFGEVPPSAEPPGDRFHFTAREYDADTLLQYNRARYYDPTPGRWLTEDSPAPQTADDRPLQ